MSIRIQRRFHPVGQGAFYTERFILPERDLNVVYDCGTGSGKNELKKIIKSVFPPTTIRKRKTKQKIEFLFLSHFHFDHICGVADLLQQCEVQYVFLPLVSKFNVFLSLAQNAANTSDRFVERLILDPVATVRELGAHGRNEGPIVVFVRPIDNDNDDFPETESPYSHWPDKIHDESDQNTIPSGLPLAFTPSAVDGICHWCFVPYHFEFDERAALFREALPAPIRYEIAYNIELCNNVHVQDFWNIHQKEITNAYRAISHNQLNDNCMTLYSGPFDRKGFREAYSLLLPNQTSTSILQPFLWQHVTNEFRQIRADLLNNMDLGKPADDYCLKTAEHLVRSLSPVLASTIPGSRLSEKLGAMYMGDFNPNQKSCLKTENDKPSKHKTSLKDFLLKYKRFIGNLEIMQDAHHGAGHNCSTELIRTAYNHVISFDRKNRYGHPGVRTIIEIMKNGGCSHFVTELPESEVVQNIEIMSDDFWGSSPTP